MLILGRVATSSSKYVLWILHESCHSIDWCSPRWCPEASHFLRSINTYNVYPVSTVLPVGYKPQRSLYIIVCWTLFLSGSLPACLSNLIVLGNILMIPLSFKNVCIYIYVCMYYVVSGASSRHAMRILASGLCSLNRTYMWVFVVRPVSITIPLRFKCLASFFWRHMTYKYIVSDHVLYSTTVITDAYTSQLL
jgi:hypothetical protein